MKVKIRGFRCYEEKDFVFETEKITMLSGRSGAGKSTVFSAIFWCLFGTKAVRNIHHHTKKYKKPNVTIELENITIFRQIAPELLKVNISGIEYESDIAQDKINKLFGSKNVWKATSYLSQKERNPLLAGSVADKMEILNSLSFSDDNIDQIIEKIEKKITDTENYFKMKSLVYDTNNTNLKNKISKLDWNKYVKPDTRPDLNLYNLDTKIRDLKIRITENDKLKGRKEYLESLLEKLESPGIVDTREIKEKISKLENLLLISKLNIGDVSPFVGHQTVSQEDLFLTKTKENDFRKSVETLKSFGHTDLSSAKKYVQDEISKLENDLSENVMRRRAEVLRKLSVSNYTETDLIEIKLKIKNIQDSMKNLVCPHCKGTVKMFNDSLIVSNKIESKESLLELQTNKNIIEACLESKRKIEAFYSDFNVETLDFPCPIDEKQSYSKLNVLKNLKLDPPKYESSFLEKLLQFQKVQTEIPETITNDILVESKNTDFSILSELKSKLSNFTLEDTQIDKLKEELSKLKINYNLENELLILEKELHENKEKKILWEMMDTITKERDELLKEQIEIEHLEKKLTSTKELKILCLELECETLQKTVNNINNFLSKTVCNIFEDPININLMINKKNLPSGRFKQEVFLNVLYKGGENDNISDLSGGEGDRVSLAMTLALSQMSNSPFMLLDESLASLDADLQERCLESFKTNMKKTILSIEHESIEGYYDNIFHVK